MRLRAPPLGSMCACIICACTREGITNTNFNHIGLNTPYYSSWVEISIRQGEQVRRTISSVSQPGACDLDSPPTRSKLKLILNKKKSELFSRASALFFFLVAALWMYCSGSIWQVVGAVLVKLLFIWQPF